MLTVKPKGFAETQNVFQNNYYGRREPALTRKRNGWSVKIRRERKNCDIIVFCFFYYYSQTIVYVQWTPFIGLNGHNV